ncbi:TPA: hypothetical protein HA241_04285 [Candidatus Woesearchaeota archaeon]|nr:hypothetical protein [Candidatus Woesearchaeota archaeon]
MGLEDILILLTIGGVAGIAIAAPISYYAGKLSSPKRRFHRQPISFKSLPSRRFTELSTPLSSGKVDCIVSQYLISENGIFGLFQAAEELEKGEDTGLRYPFQIVYQHIPTIAQEALVHLVFADAYRHAHPITVALERDLIEDIFLVRGFVYEFNSTTKKIEW